MEKIQNSSRRSIGDRGEETAVRYLESLGYIIVDRNYTIPGGEIDIVAKEEDIYIFIEVRYRYDESHGHPLDTFTPTKRRTLKRTIMHYLMRHHISPELARVDFIGLMPKKDGTVGHRLWHVRGVEV